MSRTIFFLPEPSSVFTFSRSAVLSSPSTMRPSIDSTATPSTIRSVIFSATVTPSSLEHSPEFESRGPHRPASVVVRARQIVSALAADELAAPRLEPFRANGAEADGVIRSGFRPSGIRARRSAVGFWAHSLFHGPKVIAQPGGCGKYMSRNPRSVGAPGGHSSYHADEWAVSADSRFAYFAL